MCSNVHNLRFGHANIRSLLNCFDDFLNFISNKDFDVIALSETWLTPDLPSTLIAVPQYTITRSDRPTRGGGLCFLVRNNISFKLVNTDFILNKTLEQLWINCKVNKINLFVGALYKPPLTSATSFSELETVLSNIYPRADQIIVMGDTNVDFIKPNCQTELLKSVLDTFNLTQVIDQPTRITDTSSTLIDIICISNDVKVIQSDTLDLLKMSDHRMVWCEVDLQVLKSKPQLYTYRDFWNFNINEFSYDATYIDWKKVEHMPDINEKVNFFSDAVTTLFDIHAPCKTVVSRQKSPVYITDTIKFMINLKDKAYKKYRKTKSDPEYQYYKDLRNYVTLAIKNEKLAYFNHKFNLHKNDPKKLWKLFAVNNIHNKPMNEISPELLVADTINNFFSHSINYPDIKQDVVNKFLCSRNEEIDSELAFHSVSQEEVQMLVNKIKTDATGNDGINLKMLKIILPFCLEALTHILNYSIENGIVPDLWKKSIIIPVPKKAKATELSDLRPINILPTVSKLAEMIIYKQVFEHVQRYNILPQVQSGFRPGHSTATALIKISNDISRNIDNSEITWLTLLDYSKAFDIINIELLIAKLAYHGFNCNALNWMTSYLNNRYQRVKINGNLSKELLVTHGVPQGSILGPLLFSIFTSDLPNLLPPECKVHMYADDTQVYTSCDISAVNSTILDINEYLLIISEWSLNNGLTLNSKKTTAMCIGTKYFCEKAKDNLVVNISLGDCTIQLSDKSKNLGVTFDQHLCFENHVNLKLGLCYAKLRCLYRYKFLLTSDIKWKLVNSLILSQVDYCSSVYYNYLNANMQNKLQIMQNSCLRFAFTNINYREHITPIYNSLHILKIVSRFELQFATLLYNILKTNTPQYLSTLLVKRSDVHRLDLRFINQMAIPKHSTTKFRGSFEYASSAIFNKYIEFYLTCASKHSFTNSVKKVLLRKQMLT